MWPCSFFRHAIQALCQALFQYLPRALLRSILTGLVLTLLMTLPLTLFLSIKNSQPLLQRWQSQFTLHVYLHKNMSPDALTQFQHTVEGRPDVDAVRLITPQAGWQLLSKTATWLTKKTPLSPDKVLPPTLIVFPHFTLDTPFSTAHPLYIDLRHAPQVDTLYFDPEQATLWPLIAHLMHAFTAILYLTCVLLILLATPAMLSTIVKTRPLPARKQTPLYATIIISMSACLGAYWLSAFAFGCIVRPCLIQALTYYQLPITLQALSSQGLVLLLSASALLGLWGGLWGILWHKRQPSRPHAH